MRSFLWTTLARSVLLAFVLSCLVPVLASADSPSATESPSAVIHGANPTSAIPIGGIITNQLEPGQTLWYQTAFTGVAPFGVVVAVNAGNYPPPPNFNLFVDSTIPNGTTSVDWPGYYRVGQGTSTGGSTGLLTWTTTSSSPTTYAVEVVNNSSVPVGYALATTNHDSPAPALAAPPPLESLPPTE